MSAHRYPDAKWVGQTPNCAGKFREGEPSLLIEHYDASSSAAVSISSMMNPKHEAAAHFEVDHDGTVYQLSELDCVCWHAGKSAWKGRTFLNKFSIGIEHTNLGFMKKVEGRWMTGATGFQGTYKGDPAGVVVAAHKNDPAHVMGWEPYPEVQIAASLKLSAWLVKTFPTIKEILGHDDISPGRKSDPGPAYPMARFRALL